MKNRIRHLRFPLQSFHRALQLPRDLPGIAARRQLHRPADAHTNLSRLGANFLPACFTSNNPTIRMGSTGMPRLFANSPIPARNGFILPSTVCRPSGNTSTLYPRSTASPA